jgi:hypothetical protein
MAAGSLYLLERLKAKQDLLGEKPVSHYKKENRA